MIDVSLRDLLPPPFGSADRNSSATSMIVVEEDERAPEIEMIGIGRRAISGPSTSALLKPKFYWALLPIGSTRRMGNTDLHPPCLRVIQTTRLLMS